jgi:hypothetical protein
MAKVAQLPNRQLTFDVFKDGEHADEWPELSTFKISGALMSQGAERYEEDKLIVQLIDPATGEIVAKSEAHVAGIGFDKHRPKGQRPWIERQHKVKLGDPMEEE